MTLFTTQQASALRISRLGQSCRRNASTGTLRGAGKLQEPGSMCEYGQVAPRSTLRHTSTSIPIAACARLALSWTTLPPPPPSDRAITWSFPRSCCGERGSNGLIGTKAAVEPKGKWVPAVLHGRCLCPPEPPALNFGAAKYSTYCSVERSHAFHCIFTIHSPPVPLF